MSELDNISSVEKWVIHKKINMNTTYLLQDQTSIKEFLKTKKKVQQRRMQINHVIIALFFLYKINYQMDVYQLENKCMGTSFTIACKIMDSSRFKISVMLQLIACNIYTVTQKSVSEISEKMSTAYTTLKKYPAKKREETFSNNLKQFGKICESLFDTRTSEQNQ